jgi:hypothetical protein
MKTMKSRKEPSPFESYSSEKATLLHRCPVCGTVHEVSAARARFAYGRQLACSPDCEAERRRRNRASYRFATSPVSGNAFVETGAGCPSSDGGGPISLKLMTPGCEPSSTALKTAVGDRDDRNSRRQSTLRLVGSDDHKAALSVTVESTDVLRVRRAIFEAGGESVGILKAAPIPHSSRVRVFISMRLGALESIMTAIMRSVTACEFGRVART